MYSSQELHGLHANRNIVRQQGLQESHIAAHITERHHRCAITHQGIIGIVPFGTQGIHPYAGIRHKIRQFGQQSDK